MMVHNKGWKNNVGSIGSLLASKMNYNFFSIIPALHLFNLFPHLGQVMDAISRMVCLHANKEVTVLLAYVFCPAKEPH
jgi:hypothetical protein